MLPGAAPAYSTAAGNPPISTDTGPSGFGSTSTAGRPSTPGGSVMPSPVPHKTTTDPGRAGADAEFRVTLSSFRIAPCPLPLKSIVNSPGAVAPTATSTGSDRTPWYSTWTCVVVLVAPKYGTTAEHWVDTAYTIGAGIPSNRMRTSPAVLLTKPLLSCCRGTGLSGPIWLPHTTTICPGAMPRSYDAALGTAVTTGRATGRSVGGIASSVMEFAGNPMPMLWPLTGTSGCATIALGCAALYCQTFASAPGEKFARLTRLERSSAVLLTAISVRFKSDRTAA